MIHDIFAQPLHFLVTNPSHPVPRDLAIGADDFHIGVVAGLGAREHASVEVLQGGVPDTMEGEHRGEFGGSLVQIKCGALVLLSLVLGRSITLLDVEASL